MSERLGQTSQKPHPTTGKATDYAYQYAVGELSDYRIEANIAINRAMTHRDYKDAIYTGSLLDSIAYSATRYATMRSDRSVSEDTLISWELLIPFIMKMYMDSFEADRVILLEREPDNLFETEVVAGIRHTLEMFGQEYVTVNAEDLQDEEAYAKLIDEVINGGIEIHTGAGEEERTSGSTEPSED